MNWGSLKNGAIGFGSVVFPIVLTTLAGRFYNGEDSIFYTVDNIISTIYLKTKDISSRIKVLNPVNDQEDFADKWEKELQYY